MVHSRTVLISGASSGIGQATAIHLAQKGWTVYAGTRYSTDAQRLNQTHSNIHAVQLDVTSKQDIAKTIEILSDAVEDHGLDGLINASGLGYPFISKQSLEFLLRYIAPTTTIPIEDFKYVFNVNIFGLLELSQAALPLLSKGDQKGRIVNIGSVAGVIHYPYCACYMASKHALESLNNSLRTELMPFGKPSFLHERLVSASGIKVSIIRSGARRTSIFDKAADYADSLIRIQNDEIHPISKQATTIVASHARKTGQEAKSLKGVIDVITQALTEARPKVHYYDCWETAFLATFLTWVPTYFLDKFYDRIYHCPRK